MNHVFRETNRLWQKLDENDNLWIVTHYKLGEACDECGVVNVRFYVRHDDPSLIAEEEPTREAYCIDCVYDNLEVPEPNEREIEEWLEDLLSGE